MRFGMGIGLKNARNYNADYALEFNGTDEYLSIALPSDLAVFTPSTISAGSAPTGWIGIYSPTISYETTEPGSSGCMKLSGATFASIYKNNILTVGKKYKITIKYKSTSTVLLGNMTTWQAYATLSATSEWCTVTKVITAITDSGFIPSLYGTGIMYIESLTIKEDQGFDLNKDQEMILHSKNWDFERTLGTELASGTVTIGSKYVVTAGTVEGNAIGTEFLAVTNATTLDASNKVREIPNLVSNGTMETDAWSKTGNWVYDGTNKKYSITPGLLSNLFNYSDYIFKVGKRYRVTVQCLDYVAGNFTVQLGGGTGGYVNVGTVSANGVFTFDGTITGDYTILLQASATAQLSVDNIHIYEIPEWTATGNHTQNLSIIDKSGTGTQSMLVTASGAGDSTTNYVSLPSANIESVVSGKKYTLEGFARLDASSLGYGSNLITNGTDWTDDNADGTPNLWVEDTSSDITTIETGSGFTGNWVKHAWGGVSANAILKTSTNKLTAGKLYKCTFTYIFEKGVSSQLWLVNGNGSIIKVISTVNVATPTTVTEYFYATVTGGIGIRIASATTGAYVGIDSFELYEATPITITAQLGTKSVTSSALSIVAGTFTKFVLNFEATASEQSQDLKLYLSGAGSVYVDKLSLTQAYDMWISNKAKVNPYNLYPNILSNGGDGTAEGFSVVGGIAENSFYSSWKDETQDQVGTTTTGMIWSTWNNFGTIYKKELGLYTYKNGVLTASETTNFKLNGKGIINNYGLKIGAQFALNYKLNGQISHIQIIRFENIAQSTFNSAITGLQYPTGGGSEEVLRLTFQDGTSIVNTLKDYSSKGHTVTGINIDLTNRKRKV